MRKRSRYPAAIAILWTVFVLLAVSVQAAAQEEATTRVAVFNFHQKSGGVALKWLEKGIADRLITDFFQSGLLMPVQRDTMQDVAEQMKWAPEMMSDPGRLQMIQKAVAAHFVISGVYEVKQGKIVITASIIQPRTGKEIARRSVMGAPSDVLGLMRKLSGQLLAWGLKGSAEKIVADLPAWTRSVPAARAVYEGVDLYDQGRFHEAWLKFRQASRTDQAYREAEYWTGRMYYFMHRYKHALWAFEQFIKTGKPHPRTGDAIKEYVHCMENLDIPADRLLREYGVLFKRHPDVLVRKEMGVPWVPCWMWLAARGAMVNRDLGRSEQAVALVDEAHRRVWPTEIGYFTGGILRECILHGNRLSGLPPGDVEAFSLHTGRRRQSEIVRFGEKGGVKEITYKAPMGESRSHDGTWKQYVCQPATLAAPKDCVFTKLTCTPLSAEGISGQGRLVVSVDRLGDVAKLAKPLSAARKTGFTVSMLPHAGVLDVSFFSYVKPDSGRRLMRSDYRGFRLAAEVRRVPAHGSIRVGCLNSARFIVDVDGKPERVDAGLVGLIPVGEHTITIRPHHEKCPLGEWTTKVTVRRGKTTHVVGRMPWKPGTPWVNWRAAKLSREDPREVTPSLQKTVNNWPTILADNESIRLVWARRGDLWTAISSDGDEFASPTKLASPISTSWKEDTPKLLKDETGRYILVFLSDRNVHYVAKPYVSWSRDGVRWSAPVMIMDDWLRRYDMIQDRRGRFIWVGISEHDDSHVTIRMSRDAYRWETLKVFDPGISVDDAVLLQDKGGTYEMYLWGMLRGRQHREYEVLRYRSRDGVKWSRDQREMVARLGGPKWGKMAVAYAQGKTMVATFEYRFWNYRWNQPGPTVLDVCRTQIARGPGGRPWQRMATVEYLFGDAGTMAYHPKWGYMIAWTDNPRHSPGEWIGDIPSQTISHSFKAGDIYFIRGPNFDRKKAPAKPKPKQKSARKK